MTKRFEIFQLNNSKDAQVIKFMGWDFVQDVLGDEFSMALYDKKYEGIVEIRDYNDYEAGMEAALDKIFHIFNVCRPEDFKGHSLSTSDVVILDGRYYYCDEYGWQDFEA